MKEVFKNSLRIFCLSLIFCSAFSQGNRQLSYAEYLGGPGNNLPLGVGITATNKIVVAGNFDATQNYANHINLMSSADTSKGKILILNAQTGNLETVLHLGTQIYDFAMPPGISNKALVAGTFGVALIDLSSFSVVWDTGLGFSGIKLGINNEGECALLFSGNIYHLSASEGSMVNVGPNPYDVVNDVAIIGNRIFVTGFDYVENTGGVYCSAKPGPNNKTLQIAYLDSYLYLPDAYFMNLDSHTWGFTADQMNCDVAITRGLKLSVGQNGMLYFLGETYHAENIFQYNGKSDYVINGNQYPPTTYVTSDAYNSLANTGTTTLISYAAKINPSDGTVISGQYITSRNDSTNDFYNVREGAITSDQVGNVYVGGMAGNAIQNRNSNNISGTKVASYAGGDPALLISTPNNQRYSWQVFTGQDGKGTITGIAVSSDFLAVLGRLDKGNIIPYNGQNKSAFNPAENDGMSDAFVYVWKTSAVTYTSEAEQFQTLQIINKTLDLDALPGIQTLEIVNLQGKIIDNQQAPVPTSYSLTKYPPGIYILRICTQDQVYMKKFFLE